ncbi:hypothetical protein [Ekhidna sp.]
MQLEENRSQIWFKILLSNGDPIDNSNEKWSLPGGTLKGNSLDFSDHPALSIDKEGKWNELKNTTGTWLVNNPSTCYSLNSGRKIYVAELLELPQREQSGMIWIQKVRLVRLATNLDLRSFGIYRSFQQSIY